MLSVESKWCGVQEETLAVSATGIIVDNKHNRRLLLQRRRHRLTEEGLRKALVAGRKSFWKEWSKRAQKLLQSKLHESVA